MFQIVNLKIIYTESTEISVLKLRSVGINYHLPKFLFFTDPYCAGVSNCFFFSFCNQTAQIAKEERGRAVCFNFIVFLPLCGCVLFCGSCLRCLGCSLVRDCGISWSYSAAFLSGLV